VLPSFLSGTLVSSSYCQSYSADNTNSGASASCLCKFALCADQYAVIDGCSGCKKSSQLLQVTGSTGETVYATSANFTSSCSPCGQISSFYPSIQNCTSFYVKQACVANNKCSGKVKVEVYNVTSTFLANYTSM
jgi:hypothetical protein